MQRASQLVRERFIEALCKQVPTATRAHALQLLRWGATYGRLCERECSEDPGSPERAGQWERECYRAERFIRETCESMGTIAGNAVMGADHLQRAPRLVTPHFQGDPRGHTVRLQIAGQPLDAYERAALAVPTS